MLNILHITNNDYDGAGRAAKRLNNSLNNFNINSKMLVLYKKTNDKNIITIQSGKTFKSLLQKISTNLFFVNFIEYKELLKLFLFRAKEEFKKIIYKPKSLYNFNDKPFDFKYLAPNIKDADIIILHSIQNVLDFEDIYKIHHVYKKKIVMHPLDMEMITGGYHFSFKCNCYKTGICNSKQHNLKFLAKKNYISKVKMLKKLPCIWVGSNKYILQRILSSRIYSKKYHSNHLIYFGIEKNRYKSYKKIHARKFLKIDQNKKILLFGCANFNDLRKGASLINKIISRLENSEIDLKKLVLLTYGDKKNFNVNNKNIEWRHLGNISSSKKMNMIYRASDIMLNPSIDDLGPTTVQEAFLNNLYIVSFDLGLAKDLILNEYNGRIIKNFNTDYFCNAVYDRLKNSKKKESHFKKKKIENIKKLCSENGEAKSFISKIISVK